MARGNGRRGRRAGKLVRAAQAQFWSMALFYRTTLEIVYLTNHENRVFLLWRRLAAMEVIMRYLFFCAFLGIGATGFCEIANAQASLPPNTIDCSQFTKKGNEWEIVGTATFDFGTVKHMSLSGLHISPRIIDVGGMDLYEVIEKKCGTK